jgi:hypothetical protein
MPTRFILIDTNIWHFALVKPTETEWIDIHEKETSDVDRNIFQIME